MVVGGNSVGQSAFIGLFLLVEASISITKADGVVVGGHAMDDNVDVVLKDTDARYVVQHRAVPCSS